MTKSPSSNSSVIGKALIIGAGLAASALGAIAAKKYIDTQDDINREREALRNLKPGQRFGLFRCANCKTEWSSYFAWVGEMQRCDKCDQWVSPTELTKLEECLIDPGQAQIMKVHRANACTRCFKYQKACYEM